MQALKKIENEIGLKELASIINEIVIDYAVLQLENKESNDIEKVVNQIYYLKLIRDTFSGHDNKK